jgi:GntR family transcriptional regulator of arabinose operon
MFDETIIDRDSALPRHAQIETHFRELISAGRLAPGERIPGEIELAQVFGVSRMTVNKALLALTRAGLFQRERGLGTFVAPPQTAPRSLTVMVPLDYRTATDDQDCYFGPLCRAIQASAEELHHRVRLAHLPEGRYADDQQRWPSDGWLLISPDRSHLADLRTLSERGTAMVVIGSRWEELHGVPMVDSDNVAGAFQAVRHLTNLGHLRIALVYAGPDASNTIDRIAGYRAALEEAGILHEGAWEIEADSAERLGKGSASLRVLLSQEGARRPTAVFAAGYYLALETLNMARDLNLSVPESLSVVGYDDPYAARLAYPPLTTVRQPLAEMGRAGVALLEQRLQGHWRDTGAPSLLPPHLQVRGSVARPSLIKDELSYAPIAASLLR